MMPPKEPVYFDSHMHTPLCNHAHGEPEEYARRGVAQGLKGIMFTCHSPMPGGFWPRVRMSDAQFDQYVGMVDRCRQKYAGKLEVRLGMESDYFPGMEAWVAKLHQRAEFHYILGSVHWQGPEYRERFEKGGEEAFRRSYFENLAASAETGLFDCLAHPDLIKNYYPDNWQFQDWEDEIVQALERIAKTGVAMELNTSGLHKSYQEMNPGPAMLKIMASLGIPVVVGSDSHSPRRVAENFPRALRMIAEAGYDRVGVFEHRQRRDFLITDILPTLKEDPETDTAALTEA
jgi:histidinol-phosphatase (PHP family)